MAIRIPNTPEYTAHESLPVALNAPVSGMPGTMAKYGALSKLLGTLQLRLLDMKKERDVAIATKAYNEFLDINRDQMLNFQNMKGENSYGLDQKYDEWFLKAAGEFDKRFDTDTQAKLFDNAINDERNRSKNALARYMAAEHHRFKAEVLDGLFVNTVKDTTTNPFDDVSRETRISNYVAKVIELNPGRDMTTRIAEDLAKIRARNIQEMIDLNPVQAAGYLELWRNDLGAAYHTFKEKLKSGISLQNVETAKEAVLTNYGDTIEGLEKAVADLGRKRVYGDKYKLNLKESKELRSDLKAMLAHRVNVDTRRKQEGMDVEETQIIDALLSDDFQTARQFIKNSYFLKNEKPGRLLELTRWTQEDDPESDPGQLASLRELVNTQPFAIDREDIWYSDEFRNVTPKDKESMQKRWESLMKTAEEHPETFELYQRGLREINKLTWPGATVGEKAANRLSATNNWEQFYEKNPTATPKEYLDFFATVVKEAEYTTWIEFIDRFFYGIPGRSKATAQRTEAIRILQENNEPVTEANIEHIVKQLRKSE